MVMNQLSKPAVLVLGSGGREHALAWRLSTSPTISRVYVAPGNGGTPCSDSGNLIINISSNQLDTNNFEAVALFCKENDVCLCVVGPEQPLVDGVERVLKLHGISCFGPSAAAAQLEASKSFSKQFMEQHNIPTAKFQSFTDFNLACKYVKECGFDTVIKASGLAAGKGVIIPDNREEAIEALKQMMCDKVFGSAGETVVVEERMSGPEVSVFALSDGYSSVLLPACQDHKKIHEGEIGLNTGGMGAYAPTPFATKEVMDFAQERMVKPTIDGMRKRGTPYRGVLFLGLMLTPNGPRLLEYNVRFGDPETQVLMPLFADHVDLVKVFLACAEGCLDSVDVPLKENSSAVTVVAVSGGYPGAYLKGKSISIPQYKGDNSNIRTIVFHAGTKLNNNVLETSGGRVLNVTSFTNHNDSSNKDNNDNIGISLRSVIDRAYSHLKQIHFDGMYYRKDIGFLALNYYQNQKNIVEREAYDKAGVNISEGNRFVDLIKPLTKKTKRTGCDGVIGGFGGLFDLKSSGYKDSNCILVGATDGVGTKLKIAQLVDKHDTIGQDLVAMCVNDLIVQGAEPLFFLDYYACGHLNSDVAVQVVRGISDGCLMSNCALMGGETAEMPGMYSEGEYDLAGFSVGATTPERMLPKQLYVGQKILGIQSSGVHSNGYSLVRRLVTKSGLKYSDPCPFLTNITNTTLGEALLTPTKLYVKCLMPLIEKGQIAALCHITGGGFWENIPRIFPKDSSLCAHLDAAKWPLLPVFQWMKTIGNIEPYEMARTFNCGIGMLIVVNADEVQSVMDSLKAAGESVFDIGQLETLDQNNGNDVVIDNISKW